MKALLPGLFGMLVVVGTAHAAEVVVPMHLIDGHGVGEAIGTVTASTSPYGTILTPNLHGLAPGLHGFHVHQNPSCAPAEKDGKTVAGLAAGGHYDPSNSGHHAGPYGDGPITGRESGVGAVPPSVAPGAAGGKSLSLSK